MIAVLRFNTITTLQIDFISASTWNSMKEEVETTLENICFTKADCNSVSYCDHEIGKQIVNKILVIN